MKANRMLLIAMLALLASGCARLATVYREFDLDQGKSVSIDAQQRTILVTKVPDEYGGRDRMIYCAEPSPDSHFALGSAFNGGAQASRKSGDKVSADAANSLNSASSDALSARNASIQLLRDGLYRACEAYAAGALTRLDYAEITARYQKMVLALLSFELVSNLNRPRRDPSVTSTDATVTIGSEPPAAGAGDGANPGVKRISAVVPAATATAAAGSAQPYYTDGAIEKISRTAVELVQRVLTSENPTSQCLRYISQMGWQRMRGFSEQRSLLEHLCANLVSQHLGTKIEVTAR